MDLPYCYYVSRQIHDRVVPPVVREEAVESWNKTCIFPKVNPPLGWSSDWGRHTSIRNWVLPFPRWRTLSVDKQFHFIETWNRLLRSNLGCRGDIVPIMYNERKHDFVIFKIAYRIYFFNRGPAGQGDMHRIWALPYSEYDLSNPAVLDAVYQSRWYSGGPLCSRGNADMALLGINEAYLKLLDFIKTADGQSELTKRSLADDSRTWSPSDRREIRVIVQWKWRESHRRMNDPRDSDDDD